MKILTGILRINLEGFRSCSWREEAVGVRKRCQECDKLNLGRELNRRGKGDGVWMFGGYLGVIHETLCVFVYRVWRYGG